MQDVVRCLPLHGGPRRAGLTLLESAVLLVSLVLVTGVSATVHRRLLDTVELQRYRSAMRDVVRAVGAMPSKARVQGRAMRLQIETEQRAFRFASLEEGPKPYQRIEQTIWLPDGLVVSDVPDRSLAADARGQCSAYSFVVVAPAHHRMFRVTVDDAGIVQLDEASSL